jgi:transposase
MFYTIQLSPAQEEELLERKKKEKKVKIHRRLQCIELKNKGAKGRDVASVIGVAEETISHWLKLFTEEGFDGLCSLKYEGRRPSKLDPYKEELKKYVKDGNITKLSQLQAYVQESYGFFVEHSWLSRYCKKNSIVLTRKPA